MRFRELTNKAVPLKQLQSTPEIIPDKEPAKPTVEAPLPPTGQILRNVTRSVMKNMTAFINGEGTSLTKEEAEKRLAVCKTCPFFRASDMRCGKCGCFMSFKTYLKAEKCPIGKW